MGHLIRFAFVGYLFSVSLLLQMRFLHRCPLVEWGNLGLLLFLFTTIPPLSLHLLRPPSLLLFLPDVSLICLSFLMFYIWYLIFLSLSFPFRVSSVDKLEGLTRLKANVNVVSLNVGKLVDISQGQGSHTCKHNSFQVFFGLLLISFLSLLIRLRHGDFSKASDLWEM